MLVFIDINILIPLIKCAHSTMQETENYSFQNNNLLWNFLLWRSFSLWRLHLVWFHMRCLCKTDTYSPEEMHRTLQEKSLPMRILLFVSSCYIPCTLCTFIYAPWTKINWQMCIYKSLVVYSPESSWRHILIIMYYIWLYLVPMETEIKIQRHLFKFVSLVLIWISFRNSSMLFKQLTHFITLEAPFS